MFWIFVSLLIILIVISFIIGNKKLLNPVLYVYIGYLLMLLMSIYSCDKYNYNISNITYVIYMLLSLCIFCGFLIASKQNIKLKPLLINNKKVPEYNKKISNRILFIFFIVQIITCILFILDFISIVGDEISSQNLSDLINTFRVITIWGDSNGIIYSLSFVTSQMIKLSFIITLVVIYYFIKNIKNMKVLNCVFTILNCIPIMLIKLMMGARFDFLVIILYSMCLIIYNYLNKKNMKKIIIISICFVFVAVSFFMLSRFIVGRGVNVSFLDYLTMYFGDNLINLDVSISNGYNINGNGYYTFFGIFSVLSKFGYDFNISFFKPFVYLDGVCVGNTYGGIYDYMLDFGIDGVIILGITFGYLITHIFNSLNNKKSIYNEIYLILFARYFYSFFLDNYNGYFFQQVFSLNFIVELILLIGIMLVIQWDNRREQKVRGEINGK